MSLLSIVKQENENMGLIQFPFLTERACASIASHVINLANLDTDRHYHAGRRENYRLHEGIMAPSGFTKSQTINFYLGPNGILSSNTTFPVSVRSTFSAECWLGTISNKKTGKDGELITTKGVFSRFKRGMVGADEFMRLKLLAENAISTNEEVYLLSALDGDTATKDLCSGEITETMIGTTIWPGLRLTNMDTASGLLRRFVIQIIFPTPTIAIQLKKAGRDPRMKRPISECVKNEVAAEVAELYELAKLIDKIDVSEVEKLIDTTMAVPHFEESLYKRIAVGYAAANGTFPDIIVDDTLKALLRDECKNRMILRDDPEKEAMYQVVLNEPNPMTKEDLFFFFEKYYQMSKPRINSLWIKLAVKEQLLMDINGVVVAKPRVQSAKYTF
ncbi:MAG: hypothetical protein WC444_05690 [Candidatus Paceibacterota bacterium]